MNLTIHSLVLLIVALLTSCESVRSTAGTPRATEAPLWMEAIDTEIQTLGSFNWIVIADSTFPALATKDAHILVAPARIPFVLDTTIQSIESSGHVKPRIYATRESLELSERYAPGVKQYREAVKSALAGRKIIHLPSRSIDRLLVDAGSQYRILIIKTESTLPYSSIYLELESGYWDSQSETALRKHMEN